MLPTWTRSWQRWRPKRRRKRWRLTGSCPRPWYSWSSARTSGRKFSGLSGEWLGVRGKDAGSPDSPNYRGDRGRGHGRRDAAGKLPNLRPGVLARGYLPGHSCAATHGRNGARPGRQLAYQAGQSGRDANADSNEVGIFPGNPLRPSLRTVPTRYGSDWTGRLYARATRSHRLSLEPPRRRDYEAGSR